MSNFAIGSVKQNIIVLTIANLLIGLIEFAFNLYLSRVFGAEGLGLFSLVSPISLLFLSFMTEGLVVTISKISARHSHFGESALMDRTIKVSTLFSFLWSFLLSAVLFVTAGFIATHFLGDPSLRLPLLSVCPLMLLMSVSNIVKGHFLGLAMIKIPSAINIGEKLLRFPILYSLIRFCLNRFAFPPITLIYLCYALGEIFSVVLLLVYYKASKPSASPGSKLTFLDVRKILRPLIHGAAPICLTQCLLELCNAFTSIILKSRLCSIGYSTAEALTLMGMYKGMVFPLMSYPMILVGSICTIVVPKISTLTAAGKEKGAERLIYRALRTSFYIGIAAALIFFFFADEMGVMFYKRNDLTLMIRLSGATAPLLYTAAASTSLLISIGHEAESFRNTLLQQLLLLIFLIIFAGMPALNIYGFLLAIALSNGVLLWKNLQVLNYANAYISR